MGPVVRGAPLLRSQVERVLRDGHLARGRVEDFRRGVLEAAPRVGQTRAQPTAEAFVELRLKRVVPGLGGIRSQPDDPSRWILPLRVERQPWIAVERLEQTVSKRSNVP